MDPSPRQGDQHTLLKRAVKPALGRVMAEAAAVCLDDCNHQTNVRLPRTGLMRNDLYVERRTVTDQAKRSYADMQETTAWGASGVAILVAKEITGLVVTERSVKGTGFDYWLGEDDEDALPFQGRKARLEVSGILRGTPQDIEARVRRKKKQISPSDHLGPGLVGVVEFGNPIARVENK